MSSQFLWGAVLSPGNCQTKLTDIFFTVQMQEQLCFILVVNFVCLCSIWTDMAAALTVTGIALIIFLPSAKLMSAELKFVNQTDFRVNETSQTIVRLIVERVGDPVNVTALVLVRSC